MRDLARRIESNSRDFQRDFDRLLDNSRYDDTRREDRINQEVADFRRAAERFRDRAGDSNDLSRSQDEARQLLNAAERVNRVASRVRLDSRTYSDWSQIERDLDIVADIYNINYRRGGGYRNGGYDPRYPDDRRRGDDNWWRRLPDVIRRP